MTNVTRNYKDNVFCMLYRDKENLLSLYNAVNGTNYQHAEKLEVITLDFAICVNMHNDVAFLVDSCLNLYEQQSTPNPNMPLRNLYYIAEELKKMIPMRKLYHSTLVKIPVPKFVTFYNGVRAQPTETTLRLSDLYETKVEKPELELTIRQINVNSKCGTDILEKCESLGGYMAFVDKVRAKLKAGTESKEAVAEAVDECIREGILFKFFMEHRNEVIEMGIYDYNAEEHDEVLREESIAIGITKGRAEMIIELLKELGTVPEHLCQKIMDQTDLDTLRSWGRLAIKAGSVDEFEKKLLE